VGGTALSRFAVVSDEIDADPEVAFGVAADLGMEAVDLNSLWGRPVTDLGPDEVAAVGAALRAHGLRVHMVGGLPFKFLPVAGAGPEALLGSPAFAADMDLLRRSLEVGQALGAACARVHAFAWPPGGPERRPGGGEIPAAAMPAIVAGLRSACGLAARYGLSLGLENVRASYGNCGRNLAAVCAAVGDPRLRVIWDPANAFVSGEDAAYPDGYAAARPFIDHVHVKDARLLDPAEPSGPTAWECVGRGAVDWAGQLRGLEADGYGGLLCVETHWKMEGKTRQEATRETFAALRRIRDAVVAR
jgi:sugar phosphate isomerase/epimerase